MVLNTVGQSPLGAFIESPLGVRTIDGAEPPVNGSYFIALDFAGTSSTNTLYTVESPTADVVFFSGSISRTNRMLYSNGYLFVTIGDINSVPSGVARYNGLEWVFYPVLSRCISLVEHLGDVYCMTWDGNETYVWNSVDDTFDPILGLVGGSFSGALATNGGTLYAFSRGIYELIGTSWSLLQAFPQVTSATDAIFSGSTFLIARDDSQYHTWSPGPGNSVVIPGTNLFNGNGGPFVEIGGDYFHGGSVLDPTFTFRVGGINQVTPSSVSTLVSLGQQSTTANRVDHVSEGFASAIYALGVFTAEGSPAATVTGATVTGFSGNTNLFVAADTGIFLPGTQPTMDQPPNVTVADGALYTVQIVFAGVGATIVIDPATEADNVTITPGGLVSWTADHGGISSDPPAVFRFIAYAYTTGGWAAREWNVTVNPPPP